MKAIQLITKLNNEKEIVVCDCLYASGIEELKIPQGVQHIACSFYSAKPTLKSVSLPQGLKTIGRFAFSETKLTEISLPSTLEQIGEYAFKECKKLHKITLPESVTIIGSEAFKLCVSLKNIVLPTQLQYIGANAFSQSGVERIVLPKGLTKFFSAFSSCENLREVVVKQGIEKIDKAAFTNCKSLVKIFLPEGLTEIGKEAFAGCLSLEQIILPSTLKVINEAAFANCISLKEVTLPDGIEKILSGAFHGCDHLESISISKDAFIAEDAFCKCYKLSSLPLNITREYKINETDVEYIVSKKDERAYLKNVSCKNIHKTIFVPNGIYGIQESAFVGVLCDYVVLPESVQELETEAFKGCGDLRAVYIPKSVQIIKKNVFAGCKNLKIYCESNPQMGWLDEPEQTIQEEVEVLEGWNDYQHNKINSHWEQVTKVIYKSYNPEKCPVYTNVSRETFLKITQKE